VDKQAIGLSGNQCGRHRKRLLDPDHHRRHPAAGSDQHPYASATVGHTFSYQIIATNRPTKFYATGLPLA